MEHFDHLVIGAGISGLGMAHYSLRRGLRTLVLEQNERPGGCVRSHAFPSANGFWAELGAHTGYNSYGHLLDILQELGLSGALTAKQKLRYALLVGDGVRSILSRLHPLELLTSLPRLAFTPKEGRSVEDFYTRVLGRRNYRDLFGHAFDAVICQSAGAFPAELLFRKKPRRKGVMRSFTLPGGLEDLVRVLTQQPGLVLRLGQRVTGVRRVNGEFAIALGGSPEVRSRYLTLAVPPDQALALLPEGFDGARAALAGIGLSEIDSVAVAVPSEAVKLAPLAGLIGVHQDLLSMVSRDYLPDADHRGFTFHYRRTGQDPVTHHRHIARVLGVAETDLKGVAHTTNRLPALRGDQGARVRAIDTALAGSPLALTGNYFNGLSLEDCLIRSAAEMQRLAAT